MLCWSKMYIFLKLPNNTFLGITITVSISLF